VGHPVAKEDGKTQHNDLYREHKPLHWFPALSLRNNYCLTAQQHIVAIIVCATCICMSSP